jgi:hypothetical protein
MAAPASRGAAAKPIRRLLRVLELEEEQAQRVLEIATSELRQFEHAREVALERERHGRALITASATSGQVADRIAGLEEIRLGQRAASALVPHIAQAQGKAAARREEFLRKRVERRQAETLVRAAEAREAREAVQREQQTLDDWFLGGKLRAHQGERHNIGTSPERQHRERPEPEAAHKEESRIQQEELKSESF